MTWKVVYFVTNRGSSPVTDYLAGLDIETLDKVQRSIDILVEYGPKTPFPFSKHLSSKISELRTSGKNSMRILYGRVEDTYILLHVFKKKTNKLPAKEYELATKRLKTY